MHTRISRTLQDTIFSVRLIGKLIFKHGTKTACISGAAFLFLEYPRVFSFSKWYVNVRT